MKHIISATPLDPGDPDPQLLQDIQGYLHSLSQHQEPLAEAKDAWGRFFLAYDPLLRRFARACHMNQDAIDDCVQEAWKEITHALPGFRDCGERGRFCSWLYQIVRSKANNLLRDRARHPVNLLSPGAAVVYSRDLDPALEWERRRRYLAVRRVLSDLRSRVAPTNYSIFYLRWIKERPIARIAVVLGIQPREVCWRLHRTKRRFRRLFEQRFGKGLIS